MPEHQDEIRVVTEIMSLLSALDEDSRLKVLHTVGTFYNFTQPPAPVIGRETISQTGSRQTSVPYSEDLELSPKEFLREKEPQSDVERVACLAYFSTHYRNTPAFKTLDISKLNTEAAQPKFSNPSKSVGNALQYGYLAPSSKGFRQISASGEDFVRALPDRSKAKEQMQKNRPKRKRPGKSKAKGKA